MATAPLTITLFVPGQLTNPLNGSHGHWRARSAWAKGWRAAVQATWLAAGQPTCAWPGAVTFTAYVGRLFDDDNLASCIKPLRDEVVWRVMGVGDAPGYGHRFTYAQEVRPANGRGVLITIEPMAGRGAAGDEAVNHLRPQPGGGVR